MSLISRLVALERARHPRPIRVASEQSCQGGPVTFICFARDERELWPVLVGVEAFETFARTHPVSYREGIIWCDCGQCPIDEE